ncbi:MULTISPECIES: hypothetical protein [unclassified Pseudomonas]|uniref:hypothetical protein n=1 Tax=unclassified Pseudomonas TaxID=196821 RepID=UPI0010327D0C|nr:MULTISPECIES: hypothetical protein [unclassified Pseudomonas]
MRVIIPLVLVAHTAAAATSVDLAVQGTVSPPSCSIALSGNLNIVLGTIPSGALNQTVSTSLADVPAGDLKIGCAGPTLVGLSAVDNVHPTTYFPVAQDAKYFGLGTDSDGHNVGNYQIYLDNPSIDSAQGYMTMSSNSGSTWFSVSGANNATLVRASPTTISSWSKVAAGSPPSLLTTVSVPMVIRPMIAPKNSINTTVQIELSGSATLELLYL